MVEHLKQPEETQKKMYQLGFQTTMNPIFAISFAISVHYNILWRGCGRSLYLAQLDGNFKEKGRSEIDSENRNIHHSIQVILK